MTGVLTSVMVLGLAGLLSALVLVIAYNKLKVEEEPLVNEIIEVLPGINCGACGYPSCAEYAGQVSGGDVSIDLCRPGGSETSSKIAELIGTDSDSCCMEVKAVVRCGVNNRIILAEYTGMKNCTSANISGGGMACKSGCLGFADCKKVCPFDAITMDERDIPVIDIGKCTGCGLCVAACPRDIIDLTEPVKEHIVYVGCMNRRAGKDTRTMCKDGCIACSICVKMAPENTFNLENNLAYVALQSPEIDVSKIKCPTSCIYESRKE